MNRPQVGLAVIIAQAERVLMLKRKGAHGEGTWAPPGGHLEFGESLEECAMRETLEETGVVVRDVQFVALTGTAQEAPCLEAGEECATPARWYYGIDVLRQYI